MSYLLDTNVVSELRKRTCAPAVSAWLASVASDELYLSAIVIGEIRRGIESVKPRDPAQAAVFEAWLGELLTVFADRVIPIDAAIAERWGAISARATVPVEDGLMAATAIERDMVFVTPNVSDVEGTGARLLDPWVAR